MGKPSYAFRLPLAVIEPSHDPSWARASAATRRLLLRAARDIGLEEKRADIAAGLDAEGNPFAPLKPRTIKYRRSAMGTADKNAPPLIPAHALSRTSSLLDARAHADHVLFFWRFDAHTEGPWGRILHYHRIGAAALPVRDVFGLSPSCVARIKARVASWWDARRTGRGLVAEGLKAAPELQIPASIASTPASIKVVGRTDIEHYTFGIGGDQSAVERAIAAGTSTGFRKPGTIKPRPWADSIPKPPGPNPPRPNPPTLSSPQASAPRPPAPRPPAPHPPAPQAISGSGSKPLRATTISSLIRLADHPIASRLAETLRKIDFVHRVGNVPPLDLVVNEDRDLNGSLDVGGRVVTISSVGPHPELTLVHEIGHVLDDFAMPGRNDSGRDWAAPITAEWRSAVEASYAFSVVSNLARVMLEQGGATAREGARFVLQREIWTRSYSQYIALRAHDGVLWDQLRERTLERRLGLLWETEDFAPIARAFDNLFVNLGWRSRS